MFDLIFSNIYRFLNGLLTLEMCFKNGLILIIYINDILLKIICWFLRWRNISTTINTQQNIFYTSLFYEITKLANSSLWSNLLQNFYWDLCNLWEFLSIYCQCYREGYFSEYVCSVIKLMFSLLGGCASSQLIERYIFSFYSFSEYSDRLTKINKYDFNK